MASQYYFILKKKSKIFQCQYHSLPYSNRTVCPSLNGVGLPNSNRRAMKKMIFFSFVFKIVMEIGGWVSQIRKKNMKILEKLGVGVLPRSGKKTKAGKKFGGRSPGVRLGKIHHRVCNFFPDPLTSI